jgi:hypothetical protein
MPKCLRCNKVEVATDELYCGSCKAPAEKGSLRTSRNAWAIIGIVIYPCSFVACYQWAKYKNRSKWFTLLGFLGWIGYIVLACLKDKNTVKEGLTGN